jgi:hypothetical protein
MTMLGSAALFAVIRRVAILRPLFGMKIIDRGDCSYFGEPRKMSTILTLICYGALVPFAAIIFF